MSSPPAPASIGPYTVLRELGRGGMGVVYLARDTKLDRDVAIKALPAHLAHDPDRLARFQREAKVLASLNHPGIAAIHGLEVVDNQHYLVLEYVAGESLADRLTRGPIPIDDALPLARQIAEALEAAHEKGIVHRDLKPANLMLTPEGRIKVLDFGLARTADGPAPSTTGAGGAGGAGSPNSPTLTSPPPIHSPTIPGAIMGTAGYMSPEQARGKSVDKRSDIFSFGCVLYEMLSGLGPFGGETVTDSLGAILHREPNWTLLPPGTPALVQVLLRRCLAKDRKRRLHDIGDARIDLDQAIDDPAGTTLGFAPRSTHGARPTLRTLLPWGVTALALAAAGAGLWWGGAFGTTAPAHLAARLIIPSSTPAYQRASRPIISPDGRSIVFNARAADTGIWCFWHRPLDSFDARPLPETANAFAPAWSPDGRSIAFHAEGKLWALDLEQGGARRLLAAEPGSDGVSWSSAGTLLISRFVGGPEGLGGMVSLPAAGGTAQPLTRLDATAHERGHLFGHFLPDGQRYIYLAIFRRPDQEISVGRVYAGRLGSDERTHVADLTSKVWYADPGWLVYVDDAAIKALRFDPATCRTRGEPVLIADGVGYFRPTGNTDLSVSRTGNLVFTPPVADRRLVWFDTAGTPVGGIGPTADFQGFRISPDGARVAAAVVERRTGLSDLWVYGVARPTSTRLTTEASWEGAPVWSADGRTIFYASDKADSPEVYTIPADGSKGATRLYGPGSGGRVWMPRTASPDGRVLMVNGVVEKLDEELRVLPLDGTGPAVPFRSSPAAEDGGRFSPDGRWVAFESDESGRREVYLGPYPGPGASVQVSDGGSYPVWAPRGDRLYYIKSKLGTAAATEPSRIMAVDLKDAAAFATPPAARVFIETTDIIDSFDAAPDGQRLLVQLSPAQTEPIRVILNALPARE